MQLHLVVWYKIARFSFDFFCDLYFASKSLKKKQNNIHLYLTNKMLSVKISKLIINLTSF